MKSLIRLNTVVASESISAAGQIKALVSLYSCGSCISTCIYSFEPFPQYNGTFCCTIGQCISRVQSFVSFLKARSLSNVIFCFVIGTGAGLYFNQHFLEFMNHEALVYQHSMYSSGAISHVFPPGLRPSDVVFYSIIRPGSVLE